MLEFIEQVKEENWQMEQFLRLGLPKKKAAYAVIARTDYHELDNFLRQHPNCDPETALEILR